MPSLRNAIAIPLGLIITTGLAIVLFVFQHQIIQVLVNTTYLSLLQPHQLFEVAWLLATIDYLLNLSTMVPLVIWIAIFAITALAFRHARSVFKMVVAALLFPAGTWILFTVKYAIIGGFDSFFLLSFIIWRLLLPLALGLALSGFVSLPFWLWSRKQNAVSEPPVALCFICQECGKKYRSNPQLCVECGSEGRIRRES